MKPEHLKPYCTVVRPDIGFYLRPGKSTPKSRTAKSNDAISLSQNIFRNQDSITNRIFFAKSKESKRKQFGDSPNKTDRTTEKVGCSSQSTRPSSTQTRIWTTNSKHSGFFNKDCLGLDYPPYPTRPGTSDSLIGDGNNRLENKTTDRQTKGIFQMRAGSLSDDRRGNPQLFERRKKMASNLQVLLKRDPDRMIRDRSKLFRAIDEMDKRKIVLTSEQKKKISEDVSEMLKLKQLENHHNMVQNKKPKSSYSIYRQPGHII